MMTVMCFYPEDVLNHEVFERVNETKLHVVSTIARRMTTGSTDDWICCTCCQTPSSGCWKGLTNKNASKLSTSTEDEDFYWNAMAKIWPELNMKAKNLNPP